MTIAAPPDPQGNMPRLRSWRDRVRQVLLFELGGLVLISPAFAWVTQTPLGKSLWLMALMAAIAACWNALYNTCFDWVEGRLTGRTADRRPFLLRALHACGFEFGLLLMTLPLLVYFTGMGWWAALAADIGLALAYVVYAFFFNWGYDRAFPIAPEKGA